MTDVALLGLGAMGERMAQRLLDAGIDLTIYNRTAERAAPLAAAGARIAETPAEAADGAEFVISMLRGDDACRAVWLDPENGALSTLTPGTTVIESSTVTISWTRELERAVRATGAGFLDAPVAGSRPQAEAGALIFLVGGAPDTLARAKPVLEIMGNAIHHVGPAPAGMMLKLALNALFAVQAATLAELIGVLTKSGADVGRWLGVRAATPVASPAANGLAGQMLARNFAPLFPIDLVEKDLSCMSAAARDADTPTPIIAASRQAFARAKDQGHSGDNISGVVQLYT